ncbi:MAG: RNB domain-containing ribonuclease, partial [Solirubrobacterales bacterium]|nr:RNB domain-containing ribonuclease [Solirubrobacterales bacterium]
AVGRVARTMGVALKLGDKPTPKEFDATLREFEGRPDGRILSYLVLRALPRAEYTAEDRGHFGIGARRYAHFTSPIRRYPDLVVHRLVRLALAGPSSPDVSDRLKADVQAAAVICNDRERLADKAERFSDRLLRARFMADHIGESYDGVVSDVTGFGVFVTVENPYV